MRKARAVADADVVNEQTPATGDRADELCELIQDAPGWPREHGVHTASRGRLEGIATPRPRLTQQCLRPIRLRQLQVLDSKGP